MTPIDNTLASVILSCITILITLVTVAYSWKKDRALKAKKEADIIRSAASKTLRGIERWKSISCSIFYKSDVLFVEVAKMVKAQRKIPSRQIESARDFLWENLHAIVSENKTIVFNEDIENAYIELYSYIPNIMPIYKKIWSVLLRTEKIMLNDFIAVKTQRAVMDINSYLPGTYHSAILGNQLRQVRSECETNYVSKITKLTESIINELTRIISEKDDVLIKCDDYFHLEINDEVENIEIKDELSDYHDFCNSFSRLGKESDDVLASYKKIFSDSPMPVIIPRRHIRYSIADELQLRFEPPIYSRLSQSLSTQLVNIDKKMKVRDIIVGTCLIGLDSKGITDICTIIETEGEASKLGVLNFIGQFTGGEIVHLCGFPDNSFLNIGRNIEEATEKTSLFLIVEKSN